MKTRTHALTARRTAAVASTLAVAGWATVAVTSPVHADRPDDPAGNNGTVKIAAQSGDDGSSGNQPHVTCGFDILWFGFDEGADVVSTVELTPLAPTGDAVLLGEQPSPVFVGEDPAGGAVDLDGTLNLTPSFAGTADPDQGFHVKVTVHTAGSQGADVKHKVLWVLPCPNPDI